ALGKFTRPISTKNSEAQAYFDQGMQLMYAFDKIGAARSFREAQKRDPDCAICYWGEAWAWSSSPNADHQCYSAPQATAVIAKAKVASGPVTPVERALIEALPLRCGEKFDESTQPEHDRQYAEAMRRVYER